MHEHQQWFWSLSPGGGLGEGSAVRPTLIGLLASLQRKLSLTFPKNHPALEWNCNREHFKNTEIYILFGLDPCPILPPVWPLTDWIIEDSGQYWPISPGHCVAEGDISNRNTVKTFQENCLFKYTLDPNFYWIICNWWTIWIVCFRIFVYVWSSVKFFR